MLFILIILYEVSAPVHPPNVSNETFENVRPAPLAVLIVGLLVVGTPVAVGVNARGARSHGVGVALLLAGAAYVGLSGCCTNSSPQIDMPSKTNNSCVNF